MISLIGGLGDQIDQIVWAQISSNLFTIKDLTIAQFPVYLRLFRTQMAPWLSSQPIMWTFLSSGLSLFGIHFYNYLIAQTVVLNFSVSYLLFRRFKLKWVYVFLFSLSSFFWIHLGVHPALSQLWVYPLFFHFLIKVEESGWKFRSVLGMGALIAFVSLISNYAGLFILVGYSTYTVISIIVQKLLKEQIDWGRFFGNILSLVAATVFIVMALLPYIKSNYISGAGDAFEGRGYQQVVNPIESFQSFSTRPWYFFTPSPKNPWLGDVSRNITSAFESTGNYLANDYFPAEHTAHYLGITFWVGLVYFFIKAYPKLGSDAKRRNLTLIVTALVLLSFMLPPRILFNGSAFYTPGYFMFKFFSMFRVTSRFIVFIHLSLLIVLASSITTVLSTSMRLKKMAMLLALVVLLETFVPVKITHVEMPPVFDYLRTNHISGTSFVIFPYNKTSEAFLWLPVHGKLQINTRGYMIGNQDSEKFTKSLSQVENLSLLSELNADLFLVSKENEEEAQMFKTSPLLRLIEDSEEYLVFEVL